MKGKTTTGFEFEIEKEVLNDYELLERMVKADDGDTSLMVGIISDVLGEEQKERLKEHVRNEKGKVPIERMIQEFTEILKNNQDGKNS